MKFGSQLKDAIYPEWREHYIDYDGLKRRLRKAEKERPFTEKDETEFVEDLDCNLEKVYAFHSQKLDEVTRRIKAAAEEINSHLVPKEKSADLSRLQGHINQIANDVTRLARFSRLNYTGFLKIIKKHDRHVNYVLRPMFMVRLNQCPFWKQDDDGLLIKLSELFSRVRGGDKQMSFKPPVFKHLSPDMTEQEDIGHHRVMVKHYFVHADNILEVKTFVLRHLPVLIYRDYGTDEDGIDPPISSIYLDNTALESYNGRLENARDSQVIRLRWYGNVETNTAIAFERHTLTDEEQGDFTERFVIKNKYIAGFLKGDQTFIQKSVNKMRNSLGKSEKDVQKFVQFATDAQHVILQNGLQPVLRTYYRRTAFQIPGDNCIRIALDTDLCFVREDTRLFEDDDHIRRPEGCWQRPDMDIQYPFTRIPSTDINRYPYATFEIKLDLPPGVSEPEWILDLEESGMLQETHQFSKFVHGMALLFDTRVALLPYWLAQVDEDINQLPVLPPQIPSVPKRPCKPISPPSSSFALSSVPVVNSGACLGTGSTPTMPAPSEATPLLNGRNRDTVPRYLGVSAPSRTLPPLSYTSRSCSALSEAGKTGWRNRLCHIWSNLTVRGHQDEKPAVPLPPGVKVPRKVNTPLRVEPKVFFANERTYFSWMSLGSLLSTFSIALFNASDTVGKISGIVYTLVSLTTLIYGMGLYYRRRELIRNRLPGPYDDITGPSVICFALLFAVGLNAYLKFTANHSSFVRF
ncbi:VTC domain-containing protein [Dichotomocladium elegans]|nr:VTC domain-containing protein [Dichotomocladium elegans]